MTACDDPGFHYGFAIDLFIAGVVAVAVTVAVAVAEKARAADG